MSEELKADMEKYYKQLADLFPIIYKIDPEYAKAFAEFEKQVEKDGALSAKTKRLISIALSVAAHCEFCIAFHVKEAINAGATKQEIMEAAMVVGLMGGGPASAYIRYVVDACDQFSAK